MARRLDLRHGASAETLRDLLTSREEQQQDVAEVVRQIIAQVREQQDDALCALTEKFDRFSLNAASLRLQPEELADAKNQCDKAVVDALTHAAERIRSYHEAQRPKDHRFTDATGTLLGWQWRALDAVGLYVPGGRASYPSSVLMNAIPARVAGCERMVMCVPTPDGVLNPAVLVAAQLAGIDEIYRIGGAQAVAAMAYGTPSLAPVDKIVGPGNAYVAEAKRQVFGRVGIDTIAGPSEILVVADAQNDPHWIAADLLSQAEHDPIAQSILICDDASFADAVEQAVEATLQSLSREAIARASWNDHGLMILTDDVQNCAALINLIAPEHLELAVEDPETLAAQVRHAGAIFLGRHTPEAIGDYIAGPSHVLPTSRAARFSSGLSVYDFMKKSSLIGCSAASVQAIGADAVTLAESEGLGAHALSVALRLKS